MIQLYKSGGKTLVNGIECEVKNFGVDELDSALSDGYVKTPEETKAVKKTRAHKKPAAKKEPK